MGRTACTEPQCLYKGDLYLTVELYLYSPYGPYGVYRASVPVQGYNLPFFPPFLLGNCVVYEPKSKNIGARQVTFNTIIRPMRFASWITKATDTHTQNT
jgi:hypothetical protein